MNQSRREFLKKSGCTLSMVTLATQMQHLGMMSALAQKVDDTNRLRTRRELQSSRTLYWSGGCDGNNMVIPNHADASVINTVFIRRLVHRKASRLHRTRCFHPCAERWRFDLRTASVIRACCRRLE